MEIRTEVIADIEVNIICKRCNNELNCSYDRKFGDLEVQFCESCKKEILEKLNDIAEFIREVVEHEEFEAIGEVGHLLDDIKNIIH